MTSTAQPTRPQLLRHGDPGFYDAYGAAWGFRDLLPRFFAADGTYTDVASQVTVTGRDQLDRFMKVYLGFSSTCTVTFTRVHEHSGRGFTAEWVWEGASEGPLRLHGSDSPQDGRPWSIDGVSVCTVNDAGEIASHADFWDSEALLRVWRESVG